MTDPKAYWVGFNLVKGIGAVRLQLLLDIFGDLETAWKAPTERYYSLGLSGRIIENLVKIRHDVDLDRYWERIQKLEIGIVTWEDEIYPRRLKEIDQPPPVLYTRGSIELEDDWSVAIVGTRRVSPYGRQVAEELASFLAGNQITVVSGLARGVDTAAHEAALRGGGRSIAVLGCGVDRIYPEENKKLGERLMTQGALVTDYAPGTPPDSANFPPRNRIISGLSLAVVVVEAGEKSGALITASFAANQGREVFAVPGGIHAPQSKGTNSLIQQGARPLLRAEDILDELKLQMVQEHQQARTILPADETEASLLKVLGAEPLHIDEIQITSGLPIEKVSATLAILELKGIVRQLGGMNYVVVRETSADYRTDSDA